MIPFENTVGIRSIGLMCFHYETRYRARLTRRFEHRLCSSSTEEHKNSTKNNRKTFNLSLFQVTRLIHTNRYINKIKHTR